MGILNKKISATTLAESLIATVIILFIFVFASLIINNTFRRVLDSDTFSVENRLTELEYFYAHQKIELPYSESFKNYVIEISKDQEGGIPFLNINAKHTVNSKTIKIRRIDDKRN